MFNDNRKQFKTIEEQLCKIEKLENDNSSPLLKNIYPNVFNKKSFVDRKEHELENKTLIDLIET